MPRHVTKLTGEFILALLQRNPSKRLGARSDARELMQHAFFTANTPEPMAWDRLRAMDLDPPFKPCGDDDGVEKSLRPVNFDVESSVAAMRALDDLEKRYPPNHPDDDAAKSSSSSPNARRRLAPDPSSFLDFEPVSGQLGRHRTRSASSSSSPSSKQRSTSKTRKPSQRSNPSGTPPIQPPPLASQTTASNKIEGDAANAR